MKSITADEVVKIIYINQNQKRNVRALKLKKLKNGYLFCWENQLNLHTKCLTFYLLIVLSLNVPVLVAVTITAASPSLNIIFASPMSHLYKAAYEMAKTG